MHIDAQIQECKITCIQTHIYLLYFCILFNFVFCTSTTQVSKDIGLIQVSVQTSKPNSPCVQRDSSVMYAILLSVHLDIQEYIIAHIQAHLSIIFSLALLPYMCPKGASVHWERCAYVCYLILYIVLVEIQIQDCKNTYFQTPIYMQYFCLCHLLHVYNADMSKCHSWTAQMCLKWSHLLIFLLFLLLFLLCCILLILLLFLLILLLLSIIALPVPVLALYLSLFLYLSLSLSLSLFLYLSLSLSLSHSISLYFAISFALILFFMNFPSIFCSLSFALPLFSLLFIFLCSLFWSLSCSLSLSLSYTLSYYLLPFRIKIISLLIKMMKLNIKNNLIFMTFKLALPTFLLSSSLPGCSWSCLRVAWRSHCQKALEQRKVKGDGQTTSPTAIPGKLTTWHF